MTRAALLFSFLLAACTVGDTTSPLSGGVDAGNGGGGGDQTCEGPLGPPITDFTGMEACCQASGGNAHCLDGSEVPDEIEGQLDTCASGGVCVPDQFLETGAAEPPKSCTAFGGAGVCLSICVPQVAENAGLLRPDVCEGDQLCVPCISPLDDMPTGACELAEHTTCEGSGGGGGDPLPSCDDPATCEYEAGCPPVIEPSTLPACAPDAHCVDRALIEGTDPTVAERLAPCDDPNTLCVPDVFIATGGKFTPASCTSVNGAEGRCLSMALPDVSAQADLLPQDTCQAAERCTPCFDPIDGTPTGACALSCDTGPVEPARPFAACCEDRARCVPTGLIPDDQQDQLSEDSCDDIEEDAYLCVPTEILQDGPFPACEASSLLIGDYTGVCLSDCLSFGFQGLALSQGNCSDDYKCAPCIDPISGDPTGAPGCPETP